MFRLPWRKKEVVPQPLPLVLLEGDEVVAVIPADKSQTVKLPNWFVGQFFHRPDLGYVVSLGMECDVWRDNKHHTAGWTGDEENVATFCSLLRGDTLKFSKVWERDLPDGMSELRVAF